MAAQLTQRARARAADTERQDRVRALYKAFMGVERPRRQQAATSLAPDPDPDPDPDPNPDPNSVPDPITLP